MDEFDGFAALAKRYTKVKDYRIVQKDRGGDYLILAPHGVGIEPGTSELVNAIVGDDLSYYLFEGLTGHCDELHITSTRFDEPECLKLIRSFAKAIAIHGCVGKEPIIYVGGSDEDLKRILIAGLGKKRYPIVESTGDLAGVFSTNICNRTSSGNGVQLEFSAGIRREFFKDWQTRIGRRTTTQSMEQFVADFRSIILNERIDGHVPTNSSVG